MVTPYFHFGLITVDPDDNKFIDCAIAANARYIVTNDRHYDVLKLLDFPKVDVINIQDFCQELTVTMPSEKMRYIRQRMEDKPRTDIERTPLKAEIEAIFSKRNIDEDCDTIASLLSPYRKLVNSSLSQGYYTNAVTILLEVLESLTYHFVEDEHYNYFDDMYSPDYVCQDMMEVIICFIKNGNFPNAELQRLKDGLEKLKHTEAYEDYGSPFVLDVWEKFFG